MSTIDLFKKRVALFDSAMGTALQAAGQPAGVGSEEMNLSDPDIVRAIHLENIEAGSDIVTSNTFGVTAMMLRGDEEKGLLCLAEGVRLAVAAVSGISEYFVALGLGPAGTLLGPLGEVSYETAGEIFKKQAEAGALAGADFILLETFSDAEEFACAARAAKKASGLPVLGTMSFGESGRTFMGASPTDLTGIANTEGLAAYGANCSLGPFEMIQVIEEILAANKKTGNALPVIAQPNAGLPVYRDGESVYEMSTEEFAKGAEKLINLGISGIGGCCGTTPKMILAVRGIIDSR